MWKEYTVTYKSDNIYENWVYDAYWQFLIIPHTNETQEIIDIDFSDSLYSYTQYSINGFGFPTIKIHPRKKFTQISFEAVFKVLKSDTNTIVPNDSPNFATALKENQSLDFQIEFERYLKSTSLTKLPGQNKGFFQFDSKTSLLENLIGLNNWIHGNFLYAPGVTDTATVLEKVLKQRSGVCQDFAHLFCAICRENQIPCRYISGYLNHESGYLGDSQMHAWVEAFVPGLGWIGFDPTNDIRTDINHIKVSHGKDYNDCPPLKGIVYSKGSHRTLHAVTVKNQQQQIQQ